MKLDEAEYKRHSRVQFEAVQARRAGRLVSAGEYLEQPRQKRRPWPSSRT